MIFVGTILILIVQPAIRDFFRARGKTRIRVTGNGSSSTKPAGAAGIFRAGPAAFEPAAGWCAPQLW